ncbi:ribonuclease P/MRP protein subunit POP5 [Neocloeon triangulifer]|uniref:ribonuclease P/MRP protein subunit POP5 n=1 Tax=Neocloeon triangulifer TaxID=2078957 RepID=UPI00286EC825|nr:ribonuclease P/MRP protein subunit POP5 [Neocloeon triangulifer]
MVRFKNRYLVLEAIPIDGKNKSKFHMKPQALYSAILEKIELLHGDFGVAAVRNGFLTKYCSEKTQVAYVRARHGPHKLVASAIPLVTKIEGAQVTLKTIYTGGSVMQCNKFLRDYHIKELEKTLPLIKDEDERKKVQESFLCFRQVGEERSNINP